VNKLAKTDTKNDSKQQQHRQGAGAAICCDRDIKPGLLQ